VGEEYKIDVAEKRFVEVYWIQIDDYRVQW